MARNKKHTNDKFYTKRDIAIFLISEFNLDTYKTVIEPSAGNGSFSDNINHSNLLALDIEPENDSITKQDWFNFSFNKIGKTLAIGNPPFGNQGSLAMKFIKKCDKLCIDTIAFILPKSFKKNSVKNRVPLNYHLIKEIDLADDCFTLLDQNYNVPSVFQIWERCEILREKVESKTISPLIQFVKKNENPDYSFRRVGFNAGTISDDCDKSEQSHYFIKSNSKVKEILQNHKWEHNNTAGPRSIGKSEIIRILEEFTKS